MHMKNEQKAFQVHMRWEVRGADFCAHTTFQLACLEFTERFTLYKETDREKCFKQGGGGGGLENGDHIVKSSLITFSPITADNLFYRCGVSCSVIWRLLWCCQALDWYTLLQSCSK